MTCPYDKCHSQCEEGETACHFHAKMLRKAKKSFEPISAKSEKQSEADKKYAVICKAFKITHPECQARLAGCTRWTDDVHHQGGKLGSRLTDDKLFLAVCRNCHNIIESKPEFAKALGLSINRLTKTEHHVQ